MKNCLPVLACAAGSILVAGASAEPTQFNRASPAQKHRAAHVPFETESPAGDDFFEGFEDYAVGSDIVGQGGWEVWYLGGEHAEVSDDTAADGFNSLKLPPWSDVLHRVDISEGQWICSVMTFLPSTSESDGYLVLMNQYETPTDSWSVQVRLSPAMDLVESQWDFHSTSTIEDEWVELRCEIDLDADRMNIYYNGELFAPDLVWTENVNPGGITSIACVNLCSENSEFDPVYFDAVSLTRPGQKCPPDLDENGVLDLFDFLTFINVFSAGQPEADCDLDGGLELADFLCFQGEFNEGC